LEARDRIGGRVCQTTLPSGQLVDLGPNWIHGTDDNPILDLAKDTGTVTHGWDEGIKNIFDESGKIVKDVQKLFDDGWNIVLQAFEHSLKNTSTIDPNESLYDYFEQKAAELFPDATNQADQRKNVLHFSEMWGAMVGSSVHTQSLKYFWLEECIEGGWFTQSFLLIVADTFTLLLHHKANQD
jgi:monoamine oxidase